MTIFNMASSKLGNAFSITLVGVLIVTFSISAKAQLQNTDEIIVTATRTGATVISDVPLAITAHDQAFFDKSGVESISEYQYRVPNLTAVDGGFTQFTLRGVGTEILGAGADPGFAAHLNGLYLSRIGVAGFDFFDLERVEVLRGPQGTLYGRNSVGGTMNLITKRAQIDEFSGKGDIAYGSYNNFRARGVINFPMVDGVLAGRVSALYEVRDGFYTQSYPGSVGGATGLPGNGQEIADEDNQRIRASMQWDASDIATVNFMIDYYNNRSNGSDSAYRGVSPGPAAFGKNYGVLNGVQAVVSADPRSGPEDHPQSTDSEGFFFVTDVHLDWGDEAQLNLIAGYQKFDFYDIGDLDQSNLPIEKVDVYDGGDTITIRSYREWQYRRWLKMGRRL